MLIRTFEITLNSKNVVVREYNLAKQQVFHVQLKDRTPLAITLAKGSDGNYFWTSIPEGRQKEAEEIGRILDEHLEK